MRYVPSFSYPRPPWANRWSCDICRQVYDILDEQPTVVETQDRLDITTFGDPKRQYLVGVIKEFRCSKCV